MRALAIVLLALAGGFLAGLLVSELIGIAGMLAFGRAIGIKFLPVYTAAFSAIVAAVAVAARERAA